MTTQKHTCRTCDLSQPIEGIEYPLTCRCGTRYDSQSDPGTPLSGSPGIARRLRNYTTALAQWAAQGCPVREPDEVERLRAICRACDWYNPEEKTCSHLKCGCAVGEPGALGDKLKWSTESCPIGKWGGD